MDTQQKKSQNSDANISNAQGKNERDAFFNKHDIEMDLEDAEADLRDAFQTFE